MVAAAAPSPPRASVVSAAVTNCGSRLWQAIRSGDPAAVLKQARLDVGLSQQELGDRFGSSASTISRF
ncbi:MAG: helix-turn-helix domain-containing protein, partial [Pseudonocardiaceae bacterium]